MRNVIRATIVALALASLVRHAAAESPIENFTLADCKPLAGDASDKPVVWTAESEVSSLAGKPIRLRLALENADVSSFCFQQASSLFLSNPSASDAELAQLANTTEKQLARMTD